MLLPLADGRLADVACPATGRPLQSPAMAGQQPASSKAPCGWSQRPRLFRCRAASGPRCCRPSSGGKRRSHAAETVVPVGRAFTARRRARIAEAARFDKDAGCYMAASLLGAPTVGDARMAASASGQIAAATPQRSDAQRATMGSSERSSSTAL